MCSHSDEIVNTLECYMDELVECFEDFVKKCVVIISLGVGILIVMLSYVLKGATHRAVPQEVELQRVPDVSSTSDDSSTNVKNRVEATLDKITTNAQKANVKKPRNIYELKLNNNLLMSSQKKNDNFKTGGIISEPVSSAHSLNEKMIKSFNLSSCSKSCIPNKNSITTNSSASRILRSNVPLLLTSTPIQPLASSLQLPNNTTNRSSCCSMCCADNNGQRDEYTFKTI